VLDLAIGDRPYMQVAEIGRHELHHLDVRLVGLHSDVPTFLHNRDT
jgi:hypothetical protein